MKNIIQLSAVPPQEGDPVQTVFIPVDKIAFVIKVPLQPVFMASIEGLIMPFLGDYDMLLSKLESDGFVIFDTPEGVKAVVNPEKIMFYLNPEIGLFHLMFPGKGINVKATTGEIRKLFDEKSSIVLE